MSQDVDGGFFPSISSNVCLQVGHCTRKECIEMKEPNWNAVTAISTLAMALATIGVLIFAVVQIHGSGSV
jgi:hypothetical protein